MQQAQEKRCILSVTLCKYTPSQAASEKCFNSTFVVPPLWQNQNKLLKWTWAQMQGEHISVLSVHGCLCMLIWIIRDGQFACSAQWIIDSAVRTDSLIGCTLNWIFITSLMFWLILGFRTVHFYTGNQVQTRRGHVREFLCFILSIKDLIDYSKTCKNS